jgi:hypothetical protein
VTHDEDDDDANQDSGGFIASTLEVFLVRQITDVSVAKSVGCDATLKLFYLIEFQFNRLK